MKIPEDDLASVANYDAKYMRFLQGLFAYIYERESIECDLKSKKETSVNECQLTGVCW